MKEDGWHAKEEEFLKKIEKQCNAYHSHFNKDYQYYHGLSSRFNIPILVISSLNALCAIALNDFLQQKYVSILNAVLSAGTGVLGSIQLYMKINEKMANALRSVTLMKRLALKISKELSVDAAQRTTDGQNFLQECFGELNAALEQANPIEARINNYLALGEKPPPASTGAMGWLSGSPKRPSLEDGEYGFISNGKLPRPSEPRAKILWGLSGTDRKDGNSQQGSDSPQYLNAPSQGGGSPEAQDLET
jgi:hypothetical protein